MRDFCTDYVQALFSLAEEENAEQTYLSQLQTIKTAIDENEDFIKFLDSPAIPKEERLDAVEQAFSEAQRNIVSFIKILTEKRRAFCLGKCIDIFSALYDAKNNIERVTCITAVPLNNEQQAAMQKKLEGVTGKSIVLTNEVDPSVMGGVLLRLKNSEINGSVLQRLKDIEKAIRI